MLTRYTNSFEKLNANGIDIAQLVDLANNGEVKAVRAIKETAHFLGIGISNLIVGLSPQAVVVDGSITRAWDLIADELNSIAERSVRRGLPKTIIMASSLGDSPTLIGSLSLVLARKFASAS